MCGWLQAVSGLIPSYALNTLQSPEAAETNQSAMASESGQYKTNAMRQNPEPDKTETLERQRPHNIQSNSNQFHIFSPIVHQNLYEEEVNIPATRYATGYYAPTPATEASGLYMELADGQKV
eukprot:scaffold413_cov176-Ochromonas_danica.AAC.28